MWKKLRPAPLPKSITLSPSSSNVVSRTIAEPFNEYRLDLPGGWICGVCARVECTSGPTVALPIAPIIAAWRHNAARHPRRHARQIEESWRRVDLHDSLRPY